jgi:hypothetical protein
VIYIIENLFVSEVGPVSHTKILKKYNKPSKNTQNTLIKRTKNTQKTLYKRKTPSNNSQKTQKNSQKTQKTLKKYKKKPQNTPKSRISDHRPWLDI